MLCFFFEEITKWVDDGSPVDVVYLDFQKAFDKVPPQTLLLRLKAMKQTDDSVIEDGEISNWISFLTLPQGSVLGPTLF